MTQERGPWVPGLFMLWLGAFAVALPFMAWRVLQTKNPVDQGYDVYGEPPPGERLVDAPAPLAEPLDERDRMFVGASARRAPQVPAPASTGRLKDAQQAFEQSVQQAAVEPSTGTARPQPQR